VVVGEEDIPALTDLQATAVVAGIRTVVAVVAVVVAAAAATTEQVGLVHGFWSGFVRHDPVYGRRL
jgi:hypothetical protein